MYFQVFSPLIVNEENLSNRTKIIKQILKLIICRLKYEMVPIMMHPIREVMTKRVLLHAYF